MIKIVTDTTCDLPAAWLEEYQITTIPINIQFGLETVHEGRTITPQEFYRRIDAEGTLPTTSQPSIGQFIEIYESVISEGTTDEILSIHLTSQLSGTYQTARLTATQLQNRIKITVLDSLTSSTGLGFMVREASQWAKTGLATEEIVSRLEARRSQIDIYIMLDDLRYARMSGRIGRVRELLVSLLNIKPILGTEAGNLTPIGRARTQKKAFQKILKLATDQWGDTPVHIGVTHALAPAKAEALLAQVQSRLNCRDTFIVDVALSLAVHFGPGAVGFAVYPAEGGDQ